MIARKNCARATSGLRLHEATGLTLKDVNFGTGMVIPNSDRAAIKGTKNTFVTFINSEAKRVLKKYLASRKISEDDRIFKKGFGRSGITYRWRIASEKSDVHACIHRYIDAFCGRVPRSILARHYSDYSPEKLKEIYEKENLKVLYE